MFEDEVTKQLRKHVDGEIVLEAPPDPTLGDLAFPCFALAKQLKKGPVLIARELALKLKAKDPIEKVEAHGAYVNFFLKKELVAEAVLQEVASKKERYGSSTSGTGKTIVVEYSGTNIAKPLAIHHLRSTVIGFSLKRISEFAGHNTIGTDHLGDWGTNFGQLIYAHLTWGDEARLRNEGVNYLLDIYVKFNAELEKDPTLQDKARAWFKRLEDGDNEAVRLWELFKHVSMDEFAKVYGLLGVTFDYQPGEQSYVDKIEPALQELRAKNLLEESEGALVVNLKQYGMPPMILRKSDEASTYHARDLAAAIHRIKTYNPSLVLYTVAHQQELHFKQLFKTLQLMGLPDVFVHVSFGMLRMIGGTLSTRKGKVIYMADVLNQAIDLARKTIEKKNPALPDKETVARQVGVGAVVFGDLMNDRQRDVIFDWDKVLDFEGDTGPYVQYSHARACAVLRKAGGRKPEADASQLRADEEKEVVRLLARFPNAVEQAWKQYKPHHIAQHLLQLCRAFNVFYAKCPVLTAPTPELREARLALVDAVRQVVKNGLWLLNISAPEEM